MSASAVKEVNSLQPDAEAECDCANSPVILVVGDLSVWKSSGCALSGDTMITFAEISNVTPELLDTMRPDIVLSPLLCHSFDCLDLAQLLSEHEFEGRYRVIAPNLPKPDVIAAEIKLLSPNLDFSFIFESETELARLN